MYLIEDVTRKGTGRRGADTYNKWNAFKKRKEAHVGGVCSVASSCKRKLIVFFCFVFSIGLMDYHYFFFYLLTFGNKGSSCLFILSILN